MLYEKKKNYTTVGTVLNVFVVSDLGPGSGGIAAEDVAAENTPILPPPQFDAPHFLDFASSVLEALNTNVINLTALEMEAADFSAPPPGPDEASDGNLQKDVIQKYVTGPAEPGNDGNLQGTSLGHGADSRSIAALEAQLLEAVTGEISMTCPQNILTDSFISSELPSEPRYVSISLCSLPLLGSKRKVFSKVS